jgi:hypothetical protein
MFFNRESRAERDSEVKRTDPDAFYDLWWTDGKPS